MYEVARERVFSAAHQLRNYQGSCERLHGHNWKMRVHVRAAELDALGMVIDFHVLDRLINEATADFDHRNLNEIPPFDVTNPSSENLARVVGERVAALLAADPRVRVVRCDVWENERSRASYFLP